jgi:hypothetical protein
MGVLGESTSVLVNGTGHWQPGEFIRSADTVLGVAVGPAQMQVADTGVVIDYSNEYPADWRAILDIYGFPKDLTDPPDGGYSFVEYEELSVSQKIQKLEQTHDDGMDAIVRQAMRDYLTDEHATSPASVVQSVCIQVIEARKIQKERDAQSLTNKVADLNQPVAVVHAAAMLANQGKRVLVAQPHEIANARIGQNISKMRCAKGTPAWVAFNLHRGTPVIPGEMVQAITTSAAFHDGTGGDGGDIYACWVMTL